MKRLKSIILLFSCFLLMTGFAVPLESNDDEIYKNEGHIHHQLIPGEFQVMLFFIKIREVNND